jgi:hypothetical protein
MLAWMILPKTESGFYSYLEGAERKLFRRGQARFNFPKICDQGTFMSGWHQVEKK